MVEFTTLLLDLAVIIVAAEVGSIVFERFRLPRVLGMLVAGMALSPFTPGYRVDPNDVANLAQLGAVFLMFGIGLSFNVADFRRLGAKALLLSVNASGLSFLLGYAAGVALGQSMVTSLFLGLMLMSTSTLVTVRMMQDLGLLALRGVDTTIAAIILDDLVALIAMTVVLGLISAGELRLPALAIGIGLIFALVSIIVLLGLKTIPPAMAYLERVSPPSIVLLGMSVCFFVAFLFAANGIPPLVGAFLAGSIIASTKHGREVQRWVEPIGALFTAVFFTAIGMLIDPALLGGVWIALLVVLVAAVLGKAVGGFASLVSFRVPLYPAAVCAILLIPRGEVSLVVADYGVRAGASPELRALAALLMIASTLFTPLGVKLVGLESSFLERLWARVRRQERLPPDSSAEGGAPGGAAPTPSPVEKQG